MRCSRYLIAWLGFSLAAHIACAQDSLTLQKIKETGIITLGFREGSMPFSYLDDKQRPIGYSMDLCYHVVDAVKERLKLQHLEVKLSPVRSANRIPFLTNGIVDLECGTTTNTVERQRLVGFTVTTFVANSSIVSKKSSDMRTVNDLRSQAVVSTAGSTHLKILADINRSQDMDMLVLAGKDNFESFQMVETDRVAAFVMDDVLLHALVASSRNPAEYVISNSGLSIEPYGILLRKTDPEFKRLADEAIIKLFNNGEINRLYQKWFQSPIPPKQINLKLPMSAALKRVIARPIDSGVAADYK